MRTNIDLDHDLLEQAGKFSSARSKRAIVHEALATYVAVKTGTEVLILAEGLASRAMQECDIEDFEIIARFPGTELENLKCRHPLYARESLLILGPHVTLEAGTGCVHTAPGHGAEDFLVGKQYGLEVFNPVDDDGTFMPNHVGEEWLSGAFVLDANRSIVEDLERRGLLLASADYPHSYPHCWRCKHPVLFRSTPQWFIAMDSGDLRTKALEQIRRTN